MDLPTQILCDLFIGQSTADSIAGRFAITQDAALEVLTDCEIAGTVESWDLASLKIWRLTPAGTDLAKVHPANPTF